MRIPGPRFALAIALAFGVAPLPRVAWAAPRRAAAHAKANPAHGATAHAKARPARATAHAKAGPARTAAAHAKASPARVATAAEAPGLGDGLGARLAHAGAARAHRVLPALPASAPTVAPATEALLDAVGPADPARETVLQAARRHVGELARALDCSGFVLRAFHDAHIPLPALPAAISRTESLWRASRPVDVPHPGDLAFFHDTYDRDRNGKPGDRFTHVAVVEAVQGTMVILIHRSVHGIERLRMDLARPRDESSNDRLRVQRRGDAPGTHYLAGELFAAFGALLGEPGTPMLQASHGAVDSEAHPAAR